MLVLTQAVRSLLSFYPSRYLAEAEAALPMWSLQASRLALEVFGAEMEGIPFAKAVDMPGYPLMGRVHYGMRDLLQQRIPPEFREALTTMRRRVAAGDCEPIRRSLFAAARPRNDPEAALLRFFFVEAIGWNLLMETWNQPEIEVYGCLARVEEEAQACVERALEAPEMCDADVRPLNVLVAEAMIRLQQEASEVMHFRLEEGLEILSTLSEMTGRVRAFDAPDAAALRIGTGPEKLGSQQIADRYPWHFPSANAVEKRRSRVRRRVEEKALSTTVEGERFVDIMLGNAPKEGSR